MKAADTSHTVDDRPRSARLEMVSFSMLQRFAKTERQDWLQAKARGRNQFIWRRGVLPTLLSCLIVVVGVRLFGSHPSSFSLLGLIIILPIALLGGYLEGRWKWKDFEKKYPQ